MPSDCIVTQAQRILRHQADALRHCAERLSSRPDAYCRAVRVLYDALEGEDYDKPEETSDFSDSTAASASNAQDNSDGNTIKESDAHGWVNRPGRVSPGKIVVTGIGKSGRIGEKVCATLQSTGALAVFLHPTEALHGDLGLIRPGDALLAFSYSGRTEEVLQVIRLLRQQQRRCRVVAVCADSQSPLALSADAWVDAAVAGESDPVLPAPTTSTTLALALGDCLALALARLRGTSVQEFASNHPGGNLGRKLGKELGHTSTARQLVGILKERNSTITVAAASTKTSTVEGVQPLIDTSAVTTARIDQESVNDQGSTYNDSGEDDTSSITSMSSTNASSVPLPATGGSITDTDTSLPSRTTGELASSMGTDIWK